MLKPKFLSLFVAFLLLAAYLPAEARPLAPSAEGLMGLLQQQTDDTVKISYHTETGMVRFIGTALDHPIAPVTRLPADTTPETAARQFLGVYGSLFGLRDASQELQVLRQRSADRGVPFVRFQQMYQGVPVLAGELLVNLNAAGEVTSANGEVLPDLALSLTPQVAVAAAQQRAIAAVAKVHGLDPASLTATEPQLWIYNPALLGASGPRFSSLVWRMTVQPVDLLPIRELVLVDAQVGVVALHFNQIDTARYRQVYDNANSNYGVLPGPSLLRAEGQSATGNTDVDNAYDYGGDTYDYYLTNHGRDSLDGAGLHLISTVRYCPNALECPYENAFWNGIQMVYGDDYASGDDVVAHEMTHGVTDYESSLFYFMQSGAINEALSDIWGELVDLGNGKGNDTPAVRWLMGEDLPIGAIRSMSNPPLYGQPDRMSSSNYYCGESDQGGVHTNSGIANKAAYLLVDGGSFNGQTVTAIGTTKTAKLFYEFQTNYSTSASDYLDLNDGLTQACTSLISQGVTTAADCQQVTNALNAVQMSQQPLSCGVPEAAICPTPGQVPQDLFFDNVENAASGKWTESALSGSSEWYYPQVPNSFELGPYATSGSNNIWGYNQGATADYVLAMSSNVALPAGKTSYLHFAHAYSFEPPVYDGGVVEYSTNSGASWIDASALFNVNGYNGSIASSFGNPLAGRPGFVGNSSGYISSRASLSSLTGQNVRFRFRIGTDFTGDYWGWFIDDVRVYTCLDPATLPNKGYLPILQNGALQNPTSTPGTPPPGPTSSPTATVTPTSTATNPPPAGPTSGFWESTTGDEFYVTTDQAYVDDFAIYISVGGCGDYKITHTTQVPISASQFSFSGAFYASGTFDTNTTAYGTDGLSDFYIDGCGAVSGGPWGWSATWQNSSQPLFFQAERSQPDRVEPAPGGAQYYTVEKLEK